VVFRLAALRRCVAIIFECVARVDLRGGMGCGRIVGSVDLQFR